MICEHSRIEALPSTSRGVLGGFHISVWEVASSDALPQAIQLSCDGLGPYAGVKHVT
jgi:hypothetical protein